MKKVLFGIITSILALGFISCSDPMAMAESDEAACLPQCASSATMPLKPAR